MTKTTAKRRIKLKSIIHTLAYPHSIIKKEIMKNEHFCVTFATEEKDLFIDRLDNGWG